MTYQERLKEIGRITAIGLGIGFIASIVIMLLIGMGSFDEAVGVCIVFTFGIGFCVSIYLSSRAGVQGIMDGSIGRIWNGVTDIFFASLIGASSFSPLFLLFGLIRLAIGIILLLPICLYMASAYFFNLIYLCVMYSFEKNGKLEEKKETCEKLDKSVPAAAIAVTVLLILLLFM